MRGIRRGKGKRFDYRTENAAHYHAQKKSRNNAGRGTLTYGKLTSGHTAVGNLLTLVPGSVGFCRAESRRKTRCRGNPL